MRKQEHGRENIQDNATLLSKEEDLTSTMQITSVFMNQGKQKLLMQTEILEIMEAREKSLTRTKQIEGARRIRRIIFSSVKNTYRHETGSKQWLKSIWQHTRQQLQLFLQARLFLLFLKTPRSTKRGGKMKPTFQIILNI